MQSPKPIPPRPGCSKEERELYNENMHWYGKGYEAGVRDARDAIMIAVVIFVLTAFTIYQVATLLF